MTPTIRTAFAALLAVGLTACAAPQASAPDTDPSPLTARERAAMGEVLLDAGPMGDYMRALRRYYPMEAEGVIRKAAKASSQDEAGPIVGSEAENIRRRHADGLLQAEDARLRAVLDAYVESLELLAEAPDQCAILLTEGLEPLEEPWKTRVAYSILANAEAFFAAMSQGESNPVGRRLETGGDSFRAAQRALKERVGPGNVLLLNVEKRDEPGYCAANLRLIRELAALDHPGADAIRAKFAWTVLSH